MGQLQNINANDIDQANNCQFRYRLKDSNAAYTYMFVAPTAFPFNINGVDAGVYEIGLRNMDVNGNYSDWDVAYTSGCTQPTSFSAVLSGSNISVTAALSGSQTKLKVLITDPSGGTSTITHTFGSSAGGTFTIPIANPTLYGTYVVQGQAVCDDTVTPSYVSDFTTAVNVSNPNPSAPNVFVVNSAAEGTISFFTIGTDPDYPSIAAGGSANYITTQSLPVNVLVKIGPGSDRIISINGSSQQTPGGNSYSLSVDSFPIYIEVQDIPAS